MSEEEKSGNIIEFPTGNTMFEVTPEDYNSEDEQHDESEITELDDATISQYRQQAENDGYTSTVIQGAVELAKPDNCTCYQDFEKLIQKVMDDAESAEVEDNLRKSRVKQAVQIEINRLKKNEKIAEYADEMIYKTYHTHAVCVLDIFSNATEEQLQLDIYQEPVYSVIIQINKEWVNDIVQKVLASWETREYPKEFVENYLKRLNVAPEDMDRNKVDLLKILKGTIYENDVAPDIYKQFKAVQIIQGNQDPIDEEDLANKIWSQTKSMIEYDALLEYEMEQGTPMQAATACATEGAIESLSEEEQRTIKPTGIIGNAGAFCGRVLSLKYRTAKNFDDMMMESMGEYAPIYQQSREAARQRKQELKEHKAELKQEAAMRREEEKIIRKEESRARRAEDREIQRQQRQYSNNRQSQQYYNYNNRNQQRGYSNSRYGYNNNVNVQGRDFNPSIPTWLIATIINVVIGLFTLLIFGKSTAIFGAIGLIVAVVGFLKIKAQEKGAILTIIGGYALYIAAIVIAII